MSIINLLIVDNSPYTRGMLRSIINTQSDIAVIGSCSTADEAAEAMQKSRPDAVMLSMNMPGMEDLGLLERLVEIQDSPMIIMSEQAVHARHITTKAMKMGVIGFVSKPKIGSDLAEYGNALCDIIRTAASTFFKHTSNQVDTKEKSSEAVLPALRNAKVSNTRLLVFGASTGGTEAIKDVLMRLPVDAPGTVIAQHMPEGFTGSFALRLHNLCQIQVQEATHGEPILPGNAYLAPGHSHLLVKCEGDQFYCELSQDPPVNRHRPSVDVLFHSVALNAGENAVGIILTGMGRDGAEGMRAMHDAGAYTLAQDEASCVVFGMPKEAIARGGVDEVLPLQNIARRLMDYLRNPLKRPRGNANSD